MSKAKGISTIRGKEPVLKMAAAGVEYDTGELYFDRMGRVVRQLAKADRGWLRDTVITVKQTQLMNPAEGLILTITPKGVGIALSTEGHPDGIEPESVVRLASEVTFVFGVIIDELELEYFQRIGYREHYYFACDSLEESEQWIKDLGLVQPSASLYATFGHHYALSWGIILVGEECRYRLELNGRERQAIVPIGASEMTVKHSRAKHLGKKDLLKLMVAKRHRQTDPEYAAVLDMDAFLWDETDADFDVGGFIKRRAEANLNLFRQCLSN